MTLFIYDNGKKSIQSFSWAFLYTFLQGGAGIRMPNRTSVGQSDRGSKKKGLHQKNLPSKTVDEVFKKYITNIILLLTYPRELHNLEKSGKR
jgi:hypothetical protein